MLTAETWFTIFPLGMLRDDSKFLQKPKYTNPAAYVSKPPPLRLCLDFVQ